MLGNSVNDNDQSIEREHKEMLESRTRYHSIPNNSNLEPNSVIKSRI